MTPLNLPVWWEYELMECNRLNGRHLIVRSYYHTHTCLPADPTYNYCPSRVGIAYGVPDMSYAAHGVVCRSAGSLRAALLTLAIRLCLTTGLSGGGDIIVVQPERDRVDDALCQHNALRVYRWPPHIQSRRLAA